MFRALSCLLAVLTLASVCPAQTPAATTGSAAIAGRVVDQATGRPLGNVRVHAASTALPDGRTTYTGPRGEFVLTALPAGHYALTAIKATYLTAAYGQPRPLEPGAPIDVAAKQPISGIDFRLVRAGVIAGRVTDELGLPSRALVIASHYQFVRGARVLAFAAMKASDDRGEFRLFDLAPGQYYVSAAMQDGASPDRTRETFSLIHFPGVVSVDQARVVTIKAGETKAGIAIGLVAGRPVTVSGTIASASGFPLKQTYASAYSLLGRRTVRNNSGHLTTDGTFSIGGLAPGRYMLRASGRNAAGEIEEALLPVLIEDGDVRDLRVVAAPSTKIRGRVIVDRDERESLRGSALSLTAIEALENGVPEFDSDKTVRVNDDLTFELTAPGPVFIRSGSNGWFLRAIRVDGVDVTDSTIESPTRQPLSVAVELTRHPPEVSGMVTAAGGAPTRGAFVVLFAQDPQRWGFLSRYVRMVRTNPDNGYRIEMPPGEYLAVAADSIERGEWSDPDFLQRVRTIALPISLADGEHKVVPLTVTSLPRD